jgi:hypothetical protein
MKNLLPAIGCGAIDLDPALHKKVHPSGRLSLPKEDTSCWSRSVDHSMGNEIKRFVGEIPEEGYSP